MNMVRAQIDIGNILLSYTGIAIYSQLLCYGYNDVVDMRERCTLCGAGDGHMSCPDNVDWVSDCMQLIYYSSLHVTACV